MPKRVLIVGGGIIGVCCGHYLAQRGMRVTLIDRESESHEGCSFGNAGMLCPSHIVPLAAPGAIGMALRMMGNPRSPFYVQPRLDSELLGWGVKFWRAATKEKVDRAAPLLRDLHLASRACFEALTDRGQIDFGLVRDGLLMLCNTQEKLDEEIHEADRARRLGIPAEVLDERQIAALEPGIAMKIAGGVLYPRDCCLSPRRLMQQMRRRLIESGATILWNTPITGWRIDGSAIRAARTSIGEIDADEFVLAAGSWSSGIVRELGLKLPMQPGKGYSLTLPSPTQSPQICCILTEARVAVTPMDGQLRFAGTMELAGMDESINHERVAGIIDSVQQFYPQFTPEDFRDVKPWCGLRPCSPDGLPYLGRTKRFANLAIATGHAMMGISLGPITGRLIAEILNGEKPAIDTALLDPDRYA